MVMSCEVSGVYHPVAALSAIYVQLPTLAIWVAVKIMVPFGVPIIIRHLNI